MIATLESDDDSTVPPLSRAERLMATVAQDDGHIKGWIERQPPEATAGDTESFYRCWLATALHAMVSPNIHVAVGCVYFDQDGDIGEVFELSQAMAHRVMALEHVHPGGITWGEVLALWDFRLPPATALLPLTEYPIDDSTSSV